MIIKIRDNILNQEDEKILLIAIIGSLEAIKYGGITIDEAEKFLFSPYMRNQLKAKGCNERILELIMKGCELEDIASLIPEKLNEVIEEMQQETLALVKKYQEFNRFFWIKQQEM